MINRLWVCILVFGCSMCGVCFADEHADLLSQLKKSTDLEALRAWKGPTFGLRIVHVEAGSSGERLGFHVDDILTHMDEVPLRTKLTFTSLRSGRPVILTRFDSKKQVTDRIKTEPGLIGIRFDDYWRPAPSYCRSLDFSTDAHWSGLLAILSFKRGDYPGMRDCLKRIDMRARSTEAMKTLLAIDQCHGAGAMPAIPAILNQVPNDVTGMVLPYLMDGLACDGRYRELVDLATANTDIVHHSGMSILRRTEDYLRKEAEVRKADLKSIRSAPWVRYQALSSVFDAAHSPQEWAKQLNLGKTFDFSIESGHFQMCAFNEAANSVWTHVEIAFTQSDSIETGFVRGAKLGYVAGHGEPEGNGPRIHMFLDEGGEVTFSASQESIATSLAQVKCGRQNFISMDLIIFNGIWFSMVNDQEVARGPVIDPVRDHCFYYPLLHLCGISGTCRKMTVSKLAPLSKVPVPE